jgi:hypothetical protein
MFAAILVRADDRLWTVGPLLMTQSGQGWALPPPYRNDVVVAEEGWYKFGDDPNYQGNGTTLLDENDLNLLYVSSRLEETQSFLLGATCAYWSARSLASGRFLMMGPRDAN